MGYIANQRALLITGITLTAATMLVVGARFWARHRLRAKKGPDDWCSLAAGVVFWANNVAMWWGVINGYQGIDPLTMGLEQLKISLEMIFAGIFLMSIILTLCRLSVLFLYNRLFGVYRTFRRILVAYGVVSLAWPIVICLAATFRCKPVKASWDLTANPRCAFNLETLFVSMESINAVLDIFLVVLPIGKIKTLRLPLREKFGLALVFVMGEFVGLTSVFRIVFTYNPTKRGAVVDSIFWLWLQLATAIICACLPTLRSLLPTKQSLVSILSTVKRLLESRTAKPTVGSSSTKGIGQKSNLSDQSSKGGCTHYATSTKSDDEIALTGLSTNDNSMP